MEADIKPYREKGQVKAARANLEGCKLGITDFSDCLNASCENASKGYQPRGTSRRP